MKRYIDADKAIEKCNLLIDNADSCPNPDAIEGIEIVRDLILSDCPTGVPTADVAEIKHGHWISKEYHPWGKEYICSVCGFTVPQRYKNCPECISKMDGGKAE